MRKTLIAFLLIAIARSNLPRATAQQVPFLTDLISRYERVSIGLYEKRRAGASVSGLKHCASELRKLQRGDIQPSSTCWAKLQAVIAGKKWDERQKFIASLTLETDRSVIEPNQMLQMSLTRMFPASIEKAFASPPTVTFQS